jgi:predicted aminopeptidase
MLAGRCFSQIILLGIGLLLSGCSSVGYIVSSAYEHFSIMQRRQAIDEIVSDGSVPESLKERLREVQSIRVFAITDLGLPDNKSYTSYVDLQRHYVSWVVFVAPAFSMQRVEWCFWIAGCVPYRGYFSEARARDYARQWQSRNFDTFVAGVPAYSTLGWFDDPVLNTMLDRGTVATAELIFHELAHQKLYLKDDPSLNEAFAETVAMIGIEKWLIQQNQTERLAEYHKNLGRQRSMARLLQKHQQLLARDYSLTMGDWVARTSRKSQLYARLYADIEQLQQGWNKTRGHDSLGTTAELNNAALLAFNTYHELIDLLLAKYNQCARDLQRFYQFMEKMQKMSLEQRRALLSFPACQHEGKDTSA